MTPRTLTPDEWRARQMAALNWHVAAMAELTATARLHAEAVAKIRDDIAASYAPEAGGRW